MQVDHNSKCDELQRQMKGVLSSYEDVLHDNFIKQEMSLLTLMHQDVKRLKQEIAFYKKQTSQEQIQNLIHLKRLDKEKERQEHQATWRRLNQDYSKLQAEEQTLVNSNQESEFDLKNLNQKITEFQVNTKQLQSQIDVLLDQGNSSFVTEARKTYNSPYKIKAFLLSKAEIRLRKAQQHLKLNAGILLEDKYKPFGKENIQAAMLTNQSAPIPTQPSSILRSSCSLANRTHQFTIKPKPKSRKGIGLSQLLKFISIGEVRDKIFDLLKN